MTEDVFYKVVIGLVFLGVGNFAATVVSNWVSMKMVLYRLGLLEVKVEKHNRFGSRLTTIEATLAAEASHAD